MDTAIDMIQLRQHIVPGSLTVLADPQLAAYLAGDLAHHGRRVALVLLEQESRGYAARLFGHNSENLSVFQTQVSSTAKMVFTIAALSQGTGIEVVVVDRLDLIPATDESQEDAEAMLKRLAESLDIAIVGASHE